MTLLSCIQLLALLRWENPHKQNIFQTLIFFRSKIRKTTITRVNRKLKPTINVYLNLLHFLVSLFRKLNDTEWRRSAISQVFKRKYSIHLGENYSKRRYCQEDLRDLKKKCCERLPPKANPSWPMCFCLQNLLSIEFYECRWVSERTYWLVTVNPIMQWERHGVVVRNMAPAWLCDYEQRILSLDFL